MPVTQLELIPTRFNRGASVKVTAEIVDDVTILKLWPIFGLVECERTDRPGWYYVRGEDGKLFQARFDFMQLSKGNN